MDSVALILIGIGILSLSGLPAYLFSPRSTIGQKVASGLMVTGSTFGVYGVVVSMMNPSAAMMSYPWALPWGSFTVAVDPLSCLFLLPVFIVPMLGSVYGLAYWKQRDHVSNARKLGIFYGILAGSMALLVIARDGVLFLIAWELMALAAFFASTVDDENVNVRQSGLIYLVATHVGTLCLFAMFAVWNHVTGTFLLQGSHLITAGTASVLFVLACIGFGCKAGFVPLHVWLPGTHANAPSHVSAVLSGVMIKMGIYGLLRVLSLLPSVELWWGYLLIGAGAVSGIVGIAFSIGQQDIKRMLAYSSIENIGIIMLGIGCALTGRYFNRYDLVALGLGGSLLHVLNHSLFKSSLFFNAGAVMHAVNTRNIEQMGGLAKKMPVSMMLFVFGALAISGLPPLNGFISEWLLYFGFFSAITINDVHHPVVIPLGAVALAIIGPLAIACFVRMLGAIYLGNPRSDLGSQAHDPSPFMLAPMVILVALCLGIGIFPQVIIGFLSRVILSWTHTTGAAFPLAVTSSLGWLSYIGTVFAVVVISGVVLFRKKLFAKKPETTGTWDCGYARPSRRMQYSSSSITGTIENLLGFLLIPKTSHPKFTTLFPKKTSFKISAPDVILDRMLLPLFTTAGRFLPMFRFFQRGKTHLYVLYILIIVLLLFILGR